MQQGELGIFRSVKTWFLSRLWTVLLQLYFSTWRKNLRERRILNELVNQGRPFIGVFWHGKFSTLFPLFHGIPVRVTISSSARGQIINEMCSLMGHRTIQIPDGGREVSFEIIKEALKRGENGALAMDGPVGPYHKAKTGAVRLASELGHVIVPVSASSTRKMVVSKRWDRLELPMLFSRVTMTVGEPIAIPPDLSEDEITEWTSRVSEQLEIVNQRAEDEARKS